MNKMNIMQLIALILVISAFAVGCGSGSMNLSSSGTGTITSPDPSNPGVTDPNPINESLAAVTGRLTYGNGNPIPNALIQLYRQKGVKVPVPADYSSTSDADGYYSMNNITYGDYEMTASVNGMVVFQNNISLNTINPLFSEPIVLENYQRVKLFLVDENNSAFLGARVSLLNTDTSVTIDSEKIEGKSIIIDAIPQGHYTVSLTGYSADSKPMDVLADFDGGYQFQRAIIPVVTISVSGSDLNHWFGLLSYAAIPGPSFYSRQIKPVGGVLTYTNVPAGRYSFFHYDDYGTYPDKFFDNKLELTTSDTSLEIPVTLTYHHRILLTDENSYPLLFAKAVIKKSADGTAVEALTYDEGYIYFPAVDGDYTVSVPGISGQEIPITVSGQNINGHPKGTASLPFTRQQMTGYSLSVYNSTPVGVFLSAFPVYYAVNVVSVKPSMTTGSMYMFTYNPVSLKWVSNLPVPSGVYIFYNVFIPVTSYVIYVGPDNDDDVLVLPYAPPVI